MSTASAVHDLCRRGAWAVLLCVVGLASIPHGAAGQSSPEALLEKARYEEEIRGDLDAAIRIYRSVVEEHEGRRDLAARALLELAAAYEALGRDGARAAYERIVADYSDQTEAVGIARERLAALSPREDGPQRPSRGFRLTRLWSWPTELGEAGVGTLSPDGRFVTFVDWAPIREGLRGHADVAIFDTRRESFRLVTDRPPLSVLDVYPSHPMWSRDGRWMAYANWAEGWTHMQIRVVRPDGTGDRPILDNRQMRGTHPMAFSSDGTFVVAVVQGWDDAYRIAVVPTGDDGATILKTLGEHRPAALSLSPDDRWIAYDVPGPDGSGRHDILALAVDGSAEVPLATHPADDARAFWTPDGGRVLFNSDRSGRTALWTVPWGGDATRGEPELAQDRLDGMWLLGLTASGAPYLGSHATRSEVFVAEIDLDGSGRLGEPIRLPETHLLTNLRAAWSPDGERVAWISLRGPGGTQPHLVVRSLETGEEVDHSLPFPLGDMRAFRPDWSLDGRHVQVEGGAMEPGVRGRVSWRVDAVTGEVTRQEYRRDFAGLNSGQLTEYAFVDGRQAEGLRSLGVRLMGQTDNRLFLEGEERLRPGERLIRFRNGVYRVRTVDGSVPAGLPPEELLEPIVPEGNMGHWSLSPDGTRVVAAMAEPGSDIATVLRLVPLDGAAPVEILRIPAGEPGTDGRQHLETVRWAPDGERVLYALHETGKAPEETSIWIVGTDGGEPRRLDLPLTPYQLGNLRFHPDGKRIVYNVFESEVELWIAEGLPWQTTAGR